MLMPKRSTALCSVGTGLAAVWLAACAAVTPAALPPLPSDAEPELDGAYRGAQGAYNRCGDDYLEAQTPWQAYAALGSGVVAAGGVGTAVALVGLANLDPGGAAGATAGLGILGLVGAGAAALFGDATLTQWERAEAYKKVLASANQRAGVGIGDRDPMVLTDLTRALNEQCRAIAAARDREAAFVVLEDAQRWREHAGKLETERDQMNRDRDSARGEGERLRAQLAGEAERVRGLEGSLAEREAENGSLRGEVARLEEEQASLSRRQQKLLDEKRKLEERTSHYEDIASALKQEVKDGRVALRRLRNGVVVEMPNKVLFPSGSAELNDVGKETLAAVAAAIKEIKDRRVRIEGHTDNVPVGKNLPFDSNWELSSARAITVTKFLQENGVSPAIMSAEARSEYAPIASNKNNAGRARNRRIEIYLVPKPTGSKEGMKLGTEGAAD